MVPPLAQCQDYRTVLPRLGSQWFSQRKLFLSCPEEGTLSSLSRSTLSMSSFAASFACVSQVNGHSSITSLARLCPPAAECLGLQGEHRHGQRCGQRQAWAWSEASCCFTATSIGKPRATRRQVKASTFSSLPMFISNKVISVTLHFLNLSFQRFKFLI